MASIVIDNAFKAAEVAIVEVREADAFLAEHASIVASGPLTFDAAAFKDRKFTAATPITIDADGNVFGHAALWSQCHRGITGRCQLAPRDTDGYKHFNLRRIETTEGPIMVGQLTAGIGHAPHGLSATGTMEHYDNTDAIWAFVRAYDDRFGIAVVGKVLPDVSPERLARVGHTLSGDWRKIENRLRMVALLSVPVPGFAITASMMADEIEDLDSVQATFGLFDDDGVEPLELDADETCAPCDERRAAAMARIAEQRRAFAMSKVSAHRRAGALKALAASLG